MKTVVTSFFILISGATAALPQTTVYTNDFETTVGAEWSSTSVSTTPLGGRSFLGRFAGNDSVRLSLSDLPSHDTVTVSFELFIIHSWDGNGALTSGPDVWNLTADGSTLLNTTFSNRDFAGDTQAYPGSYPGNSNPARTGAAENNTLGYFIFGRTMDSVYELSFTFGHSASSLNLDFSGIGLQHIGDEGWGLDNLEIKISQLDVCPGTEMPESVPTRHLGVNRFALVDADGVFDTTPPPGNNGGPGVTFTIEDTAGCSCEQIIEALGLGKGHEKFGCSISAMEAWVALVNP